MILTPQQIDTLENLSTEMGEVIMATAMYEWDSVKDRKCGLTFDMILDWLKQLESVIAANGPNIDN